MKIAIATYHLASADAVWYDDQLLKSALENRGAVVDVVYWHASNINFLQFDFIVVTTTWDAHFYPDAFLKWLKHCESDGKKRLINSQTILKLGFVKNHYLGLLLKKFGDYCSANGSIVPTLFINSKSESPIQLIKAAKEKNPMWAGDIVIKPVVSADGHDTYCLAQQDVDRVLAKLFDRHGVYGLMIQPFIKAIETTGEYQLVFIAGEFCYATVKPPGFKKSAVLERKWVSETELPPGMCTFAAQMLRFLTESFPGARIARARVDLISTPLGPVLLEVELVEPNTNMACLPKQLQLLAASQYAKAILP